MIIHIGDLVDFHAISAHWDADPDGYSPFNELQETIKRLKLWYKAFPKCHVIIGNHDERLERAAIKYGLSQAFFRPYTQLFDFPKGWDYQFDFYAFAIRFFHGMGYSGKFPHLNAVAEQGQSVVMGHIHTVCGIGWNCNEHSSHFGMASGCGIDRHNYAFRYGRDFRRKPILGCGVILEGGKLPISITMKL